MTHREDGAAGPREAGRHHRRSIRLKGYDYRQSGAYFVTIVVQGRSCIFGDVVDGVVHLNAAGCMLADEWRALTRRFAAIQLDAFIIMPNHIHGVIVIDPAGASMVGTQPHHGDTLGLPPVATPGTGATTRVSPAVGNVVGGYKSLTTVRYASRVKSDGWPPFAGRLWQRNYYERVIRDEDELNRIRQYIAENPVRWAEDPENPDRTPTEFHVSTDAVSANRTVGAPLVGAPQATAHENLVSAQHGTDGGDGATAGETAGATTRVAPTGEP